MAQQGSVVDAGRDLHVIAGRDISAIASQVEAKRDVNLIATRDLNAIAAANEQHSTANTKKVKSIEDHVQQVSSVIKAGGDATLSAGQDLGVVASRVAAGNEAYLFAGNDLNLATSENADYSYYSKTKKGSWGKKSSKMTESESDLAVSSTIEAGKKLVISASQDINAEGAKLATAGALLASAGHDINLDAAENFSSQASAKSKKGFLSSKSSSSSNSQTSFTGTDLVAQSVDLKAGNDIVMTASSIKAQEAARVVAGNDVVIGTAEQHQASSQSKQSSKVGMTFNGLLSATQKAQDGRQGSSESVGSDISAGTLDIKSGRDAVIRGSTLVTDADLKINAGRDLEIVSAENTNSATARSSSKKVGEIGSWWQGATGIVKQKESDKNDTTRQSGSQVASLGGDVQLRAGEHYNQVASQVVAPKGDIDILAKRVGINAGFDTLKTSNTASNSRTAIGGTVTVPLLEALRGIQDMGKAAQDTNDGRMLALAAVNVAMSANQAVEAGQSMLQTPTAGVKISINLSDSRSHREGSQSGRNVVGSSVVAGGDVNISAKGDGANSNINVLGSRIEAGQNANLKADGAISLLAAQNTSSQKNTSGNSGWSAGIGFGFGESSGFTLDLAANKGRGKASGEDVTQTNSVIKAGNIALLESGGDTNLKGAVVSGRQVQANVGGDLNIASLQDTSTYTSKQQSANVGVSLCIPPFCYGMSSISGGISQQKMQSDYASVSEQSGIKAGDGGFQVNVKGNTDLKGAVIASTDKAVADGRNTLTTGSLTSSDIKNKAEYDATSINLSGGYGGKIGRDSKGNADATKPGPVIASDKGVSVSAPIALYAGDDSSSKTRSGISGADVKITDSSKQQALTGETSEQAVAAINTDVSSDRDGSNKLKPIFNVDEIQAGFDITGKFVQNVSVYLESRAREVDAKKALAEKEQIASTNPDLSPEASQKHRDKYLELNQEAKSIANDWGAGGTYRQIATALVAGASGNVTGGTSQFAQNMVVNYVQQQGSDYIGKLVVQGLKEGSPEHAALHAIVGCAGAAASNQSCSSGAVGASAASVLAGLFDDANPDETGEEREAKRNIITSLVTGIAAVTDPNGVATATNAATANVDNNWLATQQEVQKQKELDAAPNLIEKLAVYRKWGGIDSAQDLGSQVGFVLGLQEGGWKDLSGMATFLAHPVDSLNGITELVKNPEVRKQLGEEGVKSLEASIARINYALEYGGTDQALQLGRDVGLLLHTVAGVAVDAGGLAKGGAALARIGIEVSSKTLGKMGLKDSVKVSETVAQLESSTTRVVSDLPKIPESTGAKATAGASVDGAGGIVVAPKTIPYEPKGSVVLQGDAPVCGPACAAMTITDKTGAAISLDNAIGSFVNGVRPTGVNTLELSDVISKAGVKNTVNTTMLPEQLNKALQEGASVIVQVPAGQGKHFIIVDGVKSIDGVSYYMTRDPYVGPRGVQQGLLDGAMSTGVNAIVIGK
ncbi:hemagglutinin repeat-containing protein [Pseudomonas fildesensis]|uniref:hemagglutinin repeat-containing protein n=1 Tax=Pseudomonas fildesensis TaxID=1674920 RepID=UPI00387B9ADC